MRGQSLGIDAFAPKNSERIRTTTGIHGMDWMALGRRCRSDAQSRDGRYACGPPRIGGPGRGL
eukprot:12344524-Prorocentrum_lima.AAC.1